MGELGLGEGGRFGQFVDFLFTPIFHPGIYPDMFVYFNSVYPCLTVSNCA